MKEQYFESHSPQETMVFAAGLAQTAAPGSVYALDGDLGAGKTAFSQGFAKGLGIDGVVNSPTFTILNIYDETGAAPDFYIDNAVHSPSTDIGAESSDIVSAPKPHLPLYHFDVYRIGDIEEMDEIGYEDYFYGKGVCLVEWASMIEELLPEHTVHIYIRRDPAKGDDYRLIEIRS